MNDELPKFCATLQPVRAKDNSPPIHRWVAERNRNESRQGRQNPVLFLNIFLRPSRLRSASTRRAGAWGILGRDDPAMNCRSILGRPGGTGTNGNVKK
jgi:hypothetical protein